MSKTCYQDTEAKCEELASIELEAWGGPQRGVHAGRGIHVDMPETYTPGALGWTDRIASPRPYWKKKNNKYEKKYAYEITMDPEKVQYPTKKDKLQKAKDDSVEMEESEFDIPEDLEEVGEDKKLKVNKLK